MIVPVCTAGRWRLWRLWWLAAAAALGADLGSTWALLVQYPAGHETWPPAALLFALLGPTLGVLALALIFVATMAGLRELDRRYPGDQRLTVLVIGVGGIQVGLHALGFAHNLMLVVPAH